MPKNAHFWEKSCRIAAALGDPSWNPRPLLFLSPTSVASSSAFLALNVLYYFQIITEVTQTNVLVLFFSALLRLFSLQTLEVFVGGGTKYFLPPAAWYTSYATEKIIGVGLV